MPSPTPADAFPGEVVRLGPQDWQDYRELRLEMLLDAPEAYWTEHADVVGRSEEEWRRSAHPGTFHARVGGRPVGTWTMVPPGPQDEGLLPDDLLVVAVYVRPQWRSRGVLDALAAAALPVAREQGAKRWVLQALETNARAIAAYRRLGFELTGRHLQHPTRGTRDLEMELPLSTGGSRR